MKHKIIIIVLLISLLFFIVGVIIKAMPVIIISASISLACQGWIITLLLKGLTRQDQIIENFKKTFK